jgi:antitoxin ParD1/3/4
MTLFLDPKLQKLIDERVNSGQYSSPEDVIAAALATLDQQERFGDFAQGELDSLLAEGERSLSDEGDLDGEEAFRMRQARRGDKKNS